MISADSIRANKSNIILIPLKDPPFVSLLKNFKNLLKSNIGPNGNLKFIVSGGGYVQLSSSSSQIVNYYDQFDSPIIQFIVQIVKGQTDFGLYSGMIISSCLEHLLLLQSSEIITSKQSISFLHCIMNCCNQVFDSNELKIYVNFDSVVDFIPIVNSVLKSKCKRLQIHDNFVSELCICIIKAFLFTLDIERMVLGKVTIEVFEGIEKYRFYPGIIYRLGDCDDWISNLITTKFQHFTEMKTLLFTKMLDCENDKKEYSDSSELSYILRILDEAVQLGVCIVACQKVVHHDIVTFLRRKSVIVMERMGTELALNFERLTGSFPISSFDKLSVSDLHSMTGIIDKVCLIGIGTSEFFLMERHSTAVATLVLQTSCLAGSQQIKILVEQALSTMKTLVKSPFVCPGAGCFEVCLCMNIKARDEDNIINKQIFWLLNMFIEASGNSPPLWIDTVFKHAWSFEDQLNCNCQLVSRDMVLQRDGSYWLFMSNEDLIDFSYNSCGDHSIKKLSENAVVDSFIFKRNSIMSSLESCINLLGIGTVACVEKV